MKVIRTRFRSLFKRAALLAAPAMALLASLSAAPVQALEIIDSSGGTIYVEVNKGRLIRLDQVPATVFLANPEVADLQFKSSKLVYLIGKANGETSLFALDGKDRVLLNRKIIVGYDLDQFTKSVDMLIPDSGIKATMVNNTMVLDGVVSSPAEAEQVRELAKTFVGGGALLNRIKVAMPNQVNLRVKIAEVQRSVVKSFGIEFAASGDNFLFSTALASNAYTGAGVLTKSIGNLNLEAYIEALETEGLVSILGEPNLTALSGETASFLAGGEFPVAGQRDPDTGTVPVEFKPFGVSLSFTPTLLDDSRISLKVRPEVSQLTSQGAVIIDGNPVAALSTRRAETTVELGNGESLSIAGLLQRNDQTDISKVPGLGDIPILGALFRSNKFTRAETELVIVVTPYIVRPTQERIALPVDGYQASNDYERIVLDIPYRDSMGSTPDRVAKGGGQRLVGNPGFKVE